MFKALTDYSLARSTSQAFGFYIAYLALFIIVGGLLGLAVALIWFGADSGYDSFSMQGLAGVFAGIAASYLTYLILKAKHMMHGFSALVFIVAAAALGILGGGLLGLIIPTYLTTRTTTP